MTPVLRACRTPALLTLACLGAAGCTGTLSDDDAGPLGARDAGSTEAGPAPDAAGPGPDAPLHLDAAEELPDAATPRGAAVFVAIGKIGRITVSTDDGLTWPIDRSDDPSASCVGIDCDHHAGSSTGLTFGGGDVYASFGWGEHPSRVLRSRDGRTWETVYDARGFSFAGLTWAGDRLVGGDVTPRVSIDRGVSYTPSAWPAYQIPEGAWPNARRVGFAGVDGGRIALLTAIGDGSWADTTISHDGGATFVHPETLPSACRGYGREMAYGGGVWLQVWGGTNAVCRSTDGGDRWEHVALETSANTSSPVWAGDRFVIFAGSESFESTDGASWSRFASDRVISVAAHNPETGTFVGTGGPAYAQQRLYRSTDGGRHWVELPETDFVRSHPITHIAFGRLGD